MIKIGMIGGFGPESTLDYYRLLIETYKEKKKTCYSPEIVLYSMDINILMEFIEAKQWDKLIKWLLDGIRVLHKAGADFGFISANTPHIVFDELKEASPIPLISIVDTTCQYIKKSGLKKIGLLGTKFTMNSGFYKTVCSRNDIQLFVPTEDEQQYIHHKLMNEIELGNFLEETREGLLNIAGRMVKDSAIEGLILGCTELPLILTADEFGIPFLNTTKIHVESIIDHCILLEEGSKRLEFK